MNIISYAIKAWIDKKFCKHEWELLDETKGNELFSKTTKTFICKKCGAIHTVYPKSDRGPMDLWTYIRK